MKTVQLFAFAAVFAAASAFAADSPSTPVKPIVTAQLAKPQASEATSGTKISQQDKMRHCAKDATGKKGAERKAFMKTCLSKKA